MTQAATRVGTFVVPCSIHSTRLQQNARPKRSSKQDSDCADAIGLALDPSGEICVPSSADCIDIYNSCSNDDVILGMASV